MHTLMDAHTHLYKIFMNTKQTYNTIEFLLSAFDSVLRHTERNVSGCFT